MKKIQKNLFKKRLKDIQIIQAEGPKLQYFLKTIDKHFSSANCTSLLKKRKFKTTIYLTFYEDFTVC